MPPQDDQKIIEITRPMIPTTSRITPTVWMLTPETVAVTAQVRIAPAAMRRMLTPTPTRSSFALGAHPETSSWRLGGPEVAAAERSRAGRSDRLRLLVLDRHLHLPLRDRRRDARVLGVEVP